MMPSPTTRPLVWKSVLSRAYGIALWVAILLIAGLLVQQIYLLRTTQQDQQRLQRLAQGYNEAVSPNDRLPLVFAKAHYAAYREQFDEATLLTETLAVRAEQPDEQRLAADAFYNLANARLRQGIEWIQQGDLNQAGQALNLARDYYTRSLTLVPDHWSARYNLDINARMARQLPRQSISDEDEPNEVKKPEELWSEVPGLPSGLP
ncbi:MAG TPA: hypothetical protein VK026_04930 [Paenalcaligenes sp.]|nr:hypothetical protein [Paenalcaligenes sp.]